MSVLYAPRFAPFAYQPEHALVGYAVFQELEHPVVVDLLKERRYVYTDYPVNPSDNEKSVEPFDA
jgi:hypothetical protein